MLSALLLGCALAAPVRVAGQSPAASGDQQGSGHDVGRFWWAGQWNAIGQGHAGFAAQYSGPQSLETRPEFDISSVETLYTGWRWTARTDVLVDVESAGGKGISSALGLAGFTNLDVVRNPELGARPYLARLLVHHVIGLTKAEEASASSPTGVLKRLPRRRIEVWAGRFSLADFFDLNSVGSDSHQQFLNWTVDNNGAYDYAADTRGYTWGVVVDYEDERQSLRFAEALMPKVANGIALETRLARAGSENVEYDWKYAGDNGVLRVLAYRDRARMGSYSQAVSWFEQGRTAQPDVVATRQWRSKQGAGLNWEQRLGALRVFARAGWLQPDVESFAYTEVSDYDAVGGDVRGGRWKRPQDKLGIAVVSNGIGRTHRRYLGAGGQGFLLGDGALSYGREQIVESYYGLQVGHGISLSPDLQYVRNPGYNRARGPVLVPALRLHVDF